ncbi:MAG: hypothetical protein ACLQOZ_04120 [Acidimicrobiales bacterium]|jgi:hypothetical protein
MFEGTGWTVVPVRTRLRWLLLSVPAALAACVVSVSEPGRSPAGHYVGGALYLVWTALIVGICWWFRRTRTPAVAIDNHGIRFPVVRIFVPWADLTSATFRHKGQQLDLILREGGGMRMPRPGRKVRLSKTRLRVSKLKLPHLLIGRPLSELADVIEGWGVPVDRPPFRLRTTQLERLVFGEVLVLLFLSSEPGHLTYQTVYFWSGLVLLAACFIDRRSAGWSMVAVVTINVLVIGFVLLVHGPPDPTRAAALFTLSLSLGGVLGGSDWPFTPAPARSDR